MHVLTPFEFLARFPIAQRVVFVGNGPSLKGEELGDWIDSHDIVVRFNESPSKEHTADLGGRTHILVSNPYPIHRRAPALSDGSAIVVISPQTRRPPTPQFAEWIGDSPVLFTYAPDLVQVGNVDHTASLTTGTYGLHLLSRLLQPSRVAVTGFTMFLQDTAHHYSSDVRPAGLHAHDPSVEASILVAVCNSIRAPVTVTGELDWVARTVGKKMKPGIEIRTLSNTRWQT